MLNLFGRPADLFVGGLGANCLVERTEGNRRRWPAIGVVRLVVILDWRSSCPQPSTFGFNLLGGWQVLRMATSLGRVGLVVVLTLVNSCYGRYGYV